MFIEHKQWRLSTRDCFNSILYLNDETVNVFTSLANVAMTVYSACYIWNKTYISHTKIVRELFVFATMSYILAWIASFFAHSFSTHESVSLAIFLWRADLASIYVSIMGMCNLGFYIEMNKFVAPKVLWGCISFASVTCCASVVFVSHAPDIMADHMKIFRIIPFVMSSCAYIIPWVYKLVTIGLSTSSLYFLKSSSWIVLGGLFLVVECPECCTKSVLVQTFCHSHHIWHYANLMSNVYFFKGVLSAFTCTTIKPNPRDFKAD